MGEYETGKKKKHTKKKITVYSLKKPRLHHCYLLDKDWTGAYV